MNGLLKNFKKKKNNMSVFQRAIEILDGVIEENFDRDLAKDSGLTGKAQTLITAQQTAPGS